MRKLVLLTVFAVLLGAPFAWAAFQTWDSGTFEASPANSDPISQGDDKIRELKENIRDRAEVEHLWGTISSGGDNGRSREGNARIFYDNSEPSALSNSVTDTAGSGALDEGRLWRDADDGNLKVYTGGAFVEALTATGGDASNRFNLLSGLQFLKAGADAMDIHAHNARHRLGGSNGAWTNAVDGIPFAIQQILTDTSLDSSACSNTNTTTLSGQVFGNAGDACFSISTGLNFTGRTGSSKVLVVASVTVGNDGSVYCIAEANIYLDSMGTNFGNTVAQEVSNSTAEGTATMTYIGYSTSVSAASHEIALHVSDNEDPGCTTDAGTLMVIDLGNSN